jgi:hypothetical protein
MENQQELENTEVRGSHHSAHQNKDDQGASQITAASPKYF